MSNFKVGDRVRCGGDLGTIFNIRPEGEWVRLSELPPDAVMLTREQVERIAELYGDYQREKNTNMSNASHYYYEDYTAALDAIFGKKEAGE